MSRRFTRRHAQTAGDLGFAMQLIAEIYFRTAPLSSGRVVPRVTIAKDELTIHPK